MKKFILLLTVCALFTGCGIMDSENENSPTVSPNNSPMASPLASPLPDILPEGTNGILPENTQAPDNSTNNNNQNSVGQ